MSRVRPLLVVAAFAALACLVIAQPTAPKFEPAWRQLFNGKDLTGWAPEGNAKWTVQDGVLIGEQNQGQVGDLYTKDDFDNFELSVTFKMVWPGNSGIWFRKLPGQDGYQFDILDKKEYGVTVGTIYSGGFLSRNEDESIVRLDDWNTAVIVAEGNHITATLNGTEVADLTNDKFATGKIGFQVHGGAQYANMRIMVKEAKVRRILSQTEAVATAINNQCFVCHVDYSQEELTVTHRKAGVSCATCHGESKGHIDDEDRKTAPDRIIGHDKVAEFCRGCHTDQKKCHHAKPPAQGPEQACTECHGKHRLEAGPGK